MDEIWEKDIPTWRKNLDLLNQFDHIFMNFELSLKTLSSRLKTPCSPIAYGVDAMKFAPPDGCDRSVDLISVGRRSTVTHHALLKMAQDTNFFYVYDTIKGLNMSNHAEHRSLYANFLKRSQFTIVNRAKFDLLGTSNPQEEVGPRFFESAASGTIMLGARPNCEAFRQNFDWDDAVIEIPFDCPDIQAVLKDLNAQPERLALARKNNLVNALQRHDWAYRWDYILRQCNLTAHPSLLERKAQLMALSHGIESGVMVP
jgi:hypothetical protein